MSQKTFCMCACCISNATAAACGQKPKTEFGNKMPMTLPVVKIPA